MPMISTVSWSAGPIGTPVLPSQGFSGGGIGSTTFDGVGDYLQLPSSSDFAFGLGDFTIEAWVYFSNTGGGSQRGGLWQICIPITGPAGTSNTNCAAGVYSASGTGHWGMYAGTTSGYTYHESSVDFIEGQWFHVAQVRTGGATKLYVGGTEILSASDSVNYTDTYGIIGGWYNSSFYLLDAHLTNFRIIKGKALYTSNFTPPTKKLNPGTRGTNASVLTCFNTSGAPTDASASNHTIAVNGNPVPGSTTPF